jgi:hypothetical protein
MRPTITAATTLFLLGLHTVAGAQSIQKEMTTVYTAFRDLQPYFVDQSRFVAEQNAAEISKLLRTLRDSFHSLDDFPSNLKGKVGFEGSVSRTASLLDDANNRFSEGKRDYAWWRMRSLPTHCASCHATYGVGVQFEDSPLPADRFSALDRARFFVATRRFEAAKDALLTSLADPNQRTHQAESLRLLLLSLIRVEGSPADAAQVIERAIAAPKIPMDDRADAAQWIQSLKRWSKETPAKAKLTLADGERIVGPTLKATTGKPFDLGAPAGDPVALLRGVSILHAVLERAETTAEERRRALLLLGTAYARLDLFFAGGWAELYLEECINEFPGTKEAKKAFEVYRSFVTAGFSGIQGTDLPPEIQLKFDDLGRKAGGQPVFEPKS